MWVFRLGWAPLAMLLAAASPALASGGAHAVDDSEVETPGACHLESWLSSTSKSGGLVNGTLACTSKAWPSLEMGAFVLHGWTRGSSATTVGLAEKLNLRSQSRGVGVAVTASVGYGIDQRRVETASVIVPVSIPAGHGIRFNLDGGWQWTRAQGSALFVGGQAEIALRQNLMLMVESFTRDRGKPGGQAGLRWTVDRGRDDIDLLAGRYLDGATRDSLTLGFTIRR